MGDVSTRPQQQSSLSQDDAPLSPQRAFVVQFRTPRDGVSQSFAGRVEHVTSGQALRFQSLEELTTFLTQVMAQVRE